MKPSDRTRTHSHHIYHNKLRQEGKSKRIHISPDISLALHIPDTTVFKICDRCRKPIYYYTHIIGMQNNITYSTPDHEEFE